MSYCTNCGSQIADNAKFCHKCGATNLNFANQSNSNQRREEYVGKVLKCPACGAEISAINAICPSCGHEINSTSVDPILKKFIDDINKCDEAIANEKEKPKKGWKTWSGGKKFWWVVLNIVTSCIPLVFYLLFPFIKPLIIPNSIPVLSKSEERKVSLIENYTFPNERKIFIELMLFIKSKMTYVGNTKIKRKTYFWSNIWYTKAEQVKEQANISLGNDEFVNTSFSEIKLIKNKIDKATKIKGAVALAIAIIFTVIILLNGSLFALIRNINDAKNSISNQSEDENVKTIDTTYTWPDTGLSEYLPKPTTVSGEIITDNEKSFIIYLYQVDNTQFKNYVNQCKEKGFTNDITKLDGIFYAYNSEEYSLNLFYNDDDKILEIFLEAPIEMKKYRWPDNELTKRIPKPDSELGNIQYDTSNHFSIYVEDTNGELFDKYIDECMSKGFTLKYSRSDDKFFADDKDGYHLNVYKEKFNKILISIENSN